MTGEGQISRPPSGAKLALLSAGAFVLASAIVVLFVLPAEFHRDPTGFGKLTGIDRIAGPEVVSVDALPAGAGETTRYYATALRNDVFEIKLQPDDMGELEFKVAMKAGGSLVYSWNVTGDEAHPEWFYYDFHGESRAASEGEKPTVVEYRQATGLQSSGSLVAPFDGIHGWYVQNQSDKTVVLHLRLSGFYDLIPSGEYGNEAGVEPVGAVAAK